MIRDLAPAPEDTASAGADENIFVQTYRWFLDPEHWTGTTGVGWRLLEHLGYTGLTVAFAALLAVPVGLFVGHTGRGRFAIVAAAGALRALPTLGLLTLFAVLLGIGLLPPLLALIVLTIPPLLAGTYSGIASVNGAIVDAARGIGMTEWQILFRVEFPNALPVMLGGLRTAVLQVIATVAVVAYLNLGGLGRYLIDGVAVRDFVQMFAGAVLIAALAMVTEGALAALERAIVPRGLKAGVRNTGSEEKGRGAATSDIEGGS